MSTEASQGGSLCHGVLNKLSDDQLLADTSLVDIGQTSVAAVVIEGESLVVETQEAVRKLSRDKFQARSYVGGLVQSFERRAA